MCLWGEDGQEAGGMTWKFSQKEQWLSWVLKYVSIQWSSEVTESDTCHLVENTGTWWSILIGYIGFPFGTTKKVPPSRWLQGPFLLPRSFAAWFLYDQLCLSNKAIAQMVTSSWNLPLAPN